MDKKTNSTELNRAALFDWSVIALSFLLSFIFPALKDMVRAPSFSAWMLAALLLYAAGAWMKNLPLRYRLSAAGGKPREVPYLIFLFAGHFIIIVILLIFAEPVIRKIISLPVRGSAGDEQGGAMIAADIVIALFVSIIVFSTKKKRSFNRTYAPRYLYLREITADVLLTAGVGIITFVFWDKAIMALANGRPLSSLSDIWFLFVLLACCYMFFYLPLRYLYLIEDHTSRQTWRRFLVIFGFVLLRSLFYMLGV